MALNEQERAAIRRYCGFPAVETGAGISMGVPAFDHAMFVLTANMDSLLESGEPHVRLLLKRLDCIDDQIAEDTKNLGLRAVVGATQFAGAEGMDALAEQKVRRVTELLDMLGSPPHVHSASLRRLGLGPTGVVEQH